MAEKSLSKISKHIEQTLDLWTGKLTSNFQIEGEPVTLRRFAIRIKIIAVTWL